MPEVKEARSNILALLAFDLQRDMLIVASRTSNTIGAIRLMAPTHHCWLAQDRCQV